MDQTAAAGTRENSKHARFRFGMKGLLVAIACCALLVWAGVAIRDQLAGPHPLRVIRSGNAVERQSAAQDLLHDPSIDADAATAGLIEALDDGDSEVRAVAAKCLGSLVADFRVRPANAKDAPGLLKRRVTVASRALVSALSDRDAGVRAAAAIGLGTMAKRQGRAVTATEELGMLAWCRKHGIQYHPDLMLPPPELFAALWSASNNARRQASKTIKSCPDITFPPELLRALHDQSADVRAAAVRSLGSFATDLDAEIPDLFAMMANDDATVREGCATALRSMWPKTAAVSTLVGFLKSTDPEIRFLAAQLLGRVGPEASVAIPDLIAVLNEPISVDWRRSDPARGAARALGMMGPNQVAIAALMDVISPAKVEPLLATFPKREQGGAEIRSTCWNRTTTSSARAPQVHSATSARLRQRQSPSSGPSRSAARSSAMWPPNPSR
jgi:HEAT repeat protein